jgi:GH18 family chitinase
MVRNLIHSVLESILTCDKGDNPNLGAKIRPQTDLREIEKDLLPLWFNGVNPKKVNLGMAYYGRGYQVKDKTCAQYETPMYELHVRHTPTLYTMI